MRLDRVGAAESPKWREDWDSASDALLRELAQPRPDGERVAELIRTRQRLTTAHRRETRPSPESEQARWLEAAVRREEQIRGAYMRYTAVVERARDTHRSGTRVRAAFTTTVEAHPTRLSKKL